MNLDRSQVAQTALARHAGQQGALLPVLHAVQDAHGHVPPEVVPAIAAGLNLSRAEVHGVIGYYHHFRSEPAGLHMVRICRAEACQSMGAEALVARAEARLGCAVHGGHGSTSADGRYTLTPVFCLGLCASSPALVIDEQLHARVTPERFDRLIDALEEGGR